MSQIRAWRDRFLIGAGELVALSLRVTMAALGAAGWLLVGEANDWFRYPGICFALGLDGYGWTGVVLAWIFLPGPILLMFVTAFSKKKYTNLLVLAIAGYILAGLGAEALLQNAAGRRLVTVEIPQVVFQAPFSELDFPVWTRSGGGKTKIIFRRSDDPVLDRARRERLETRAAGK